MSSRQKEYKSVAEQIKQKIAEYTLLEEKKYKQVGSKQKRKQKSIDQWIIYIPSQMNDGKTFFTPTQMDESDQFLPFNQQLDIFIHSILSENYQKHLMRKLLYRVQNQPLKNLWDSQYTNKLSFAVHLLTLSSQNLAKQQNSNKPQSKNNKKTNQKQQNQNQNQSNINNQHSDDQNQLKNKKKKKLRKNNKRVQFSPTSHKKEHSLSDNQQKKSSTSKNYKTVNPNQQIVDQNSLLNKQTKRMIEQINAEIDRVQELYLIQMEEYHNLPYTQVDMIIQKNFKSAKISIKNQNGKTQSQQIYLLQQGIPNLNSKNSINLYPLSGMHPHRQDNPGMNDMNYSSQYFPFNPMNSQMNPLSMPLMQLNPSLSQMTAQIGQFGHQGMMSHQVFGNGSFQSNGFYDTNIMMMNMNSFGQNGHNSYNQSPIKAQLNGNNSSSNKVIMIENIDQEK